MRKILSVIVGSRAHGLATPESDYDYRGVFVIPTSEILRIGAKIHNTSWIEGKEDNTDWEVGHFLQLATHCNPTILEAFLAPWTPTGWKEAYTMDDGVCSGDALRKLFPSIWNSRDVYNAFRGYGKNQRTKFLDRKDSRPHKYACAYLRVLYQAVALLKTGTFPVDFTSTPIFETLKRWKHADYTIGEVMTEIEVWEKELDVAYELNPDKVADLEPANQFLLKIRKECWDE